MKTVWPNENYFNVQPNNDINMQDLKDLGWISITFIPLINEEKIAWMKENFIEIETEVRWINHVCICFCRIEDAMAFKLRWS